MHIYLDSNIVIYAVEQPTIWGPKALARISAMRAGGDRIVVSDLTRLECRVGPIAANDQLWLAGFDAFFSAADVIVVPLTGAVCDQAAEIRAFHQTGLGDALNLAAAIMAGRDRFPTNDQRLSHFSGILIETLQ